MELFNSCRKLAFMLISASIIMPFSALSADNEIDTIATITGIHCKLWLKHLQKQPKPTTPADLIRISGGLNLSPDNAERLMITTQGLPEFSFMLGARWDVATLRERTNFNYGFLEFLSKKHPLGSNHKGDYCDLDISLTPKEPDPTLELPQPRLFSAKVTTTLSGRTKPVRVTYYLDQDLIGWQVYDISIGKKSLTQRYSDSFYSQLSQGGYAKLNAYLTH